MADNRCPLCMEKLKNGECASCGYRLPDEENISSIYNTEPISQPEPEPIREIIPEVQMEEVTRISTQVTVILIQIMVTLTQDIHLKVCQIRAAARPLQINRFIQVLTRKARLHFLKNTGGCCCCRSLCRL